MTGYTKLFSTILGSSIWMEDDKTRIVWITLLAKADRDGNIWASVPGLAHFARVSPDDCRKALAKFMAPDPDSTSKVEDGRRVKEIEGGWNLINHAKYRRMLSLEDRRAYMAQKQAEYRAKLKETRGKQVAAEILTERRVANRKLEDDTLREEPTPYIAGAGELRNGPQAI